jgi:hypothetical protein
VPHEPVVHVHACPVCGVRHAVNAARHRVAYGRALACSPECESARRRLAREGLAGDELRWGRR